MADFAHAKDHDLDLHGDQDAMHWAERFAVYFEVTSKEDGPVQDVQGLMLAWFAGAIETGKMPQGRIVAYSIFGDFYDPKDVNIIRDGDGVNFGPPEDQPDKESHA